jgi:threonine aldolase
MIRELPGIDIDIPSVQTNIVRFRVTTLSPFDFVERCHAEGVHMLGYSPDRVRAVLHRDVSRSQVEAAISSIQKGVTALQKY